MFAKSELNEDIKRNYADMFVKRKNKIKGKDDKTKRPR